MKWSSIFSPLQETGAQFIAPFERPRIHREPLVRPPHAVCVRFDDLLFDRPAVHSIGRELFLLRKPYFGFIRTIEPKHFVLPQNVNIGTAHILTEPDITQNIIEPPGEMTLSGNLIELSATEIANHFLLSAVMRNIGFAFEYVPNTAENLAEPLAYPCAADIPFELFATEIIDVIEQLSPLLVPVIHDFALLHRVVIDGKVYSVEPPKQERAAQNSTEDKASREDRQSRRLKQTDLWELIRPILLPPLGAALNNPFDFPPGKSLYGFQADGVKFLMEKTAALLGDEMGLGKSVQTITAIRVLIRKARITSCCVLCPKAVLSDWETKFSEWSPELRVIKVSGDKEQRQSLWQTPAHVYISTYESLLWNGLDTLHKKRQQQELETHFDLLVMDEIQKTKNPSAKLTKAVRELEAKYRWGLSGTPLENSIEDLLTICRTLDNQFLFNRDDVNPYELKTACQPLFLRRRAKDVLTELPEKMTNVVWLELTENQRRAYDAQEQSGTEWLRDLGGEATFSHAVAIITKLKLICNYYNGESPKLDFLKDKLEDLTEEGNKALVFSQYPNETLKKIESQLQAFRPLFYDGSLSDNKRTQQVEAFQKDETNKVMLLSLKAGNAGITLTRANWVFHFDMWWNPAVSDQAAHRALRIGQEKTVFERFLLTRGTIEERIYQKVEAKKQLFDFVVDDLSEEQTVQRFLTRDDIFDLLGLQDPKSLIKQKS